MDPKQERPLLNFASAVTGASDLDAVVEAILSHGPQATGAQYCLVALPVAGGRELGIHVGPGAPVDLPVVSRLDLKAPTALSLALRDREPVLEEKGGPPHLLPDDSQPAPEGSAASLPLTARRRILGGIGFVWSTPQAFETPLIDRLRLIVDWSGLALERALLRDMEHQLVRVLKRDLLPTRVIDTPELVAVGAYRPAWGSVPLGGDWYDGFTLPDGRSTLVVGDVAGHGVEVVPSMLGLRHIVRSIMLEVADPAACLQRLDATMTALQSQPVEVLAEVGIVTIDPHQQQLAWAAGGLPPLLLRHPDGTVETLEEQRTMPLGGGIDGQREEPGRRPFAPGSLLVMFTDGVCERPGYWYDLEPLRRVVAGFERGAPEELAFRILEVADTASPRIDDATVLVARSPVGPGHRIERVR